MARKAQKVNERSVAPLLGAMDVALKKYDYKRNGVAFVREREEGVFHLFEVGRTTEGFFVGTGVTFWEVVHFAVQADGDWGMFVGALPESGKPSIGTCQLVANLGRLADERTDLSWSVEELKSAGVIERIVAIITQRALPALEVLGTRRTFVDKWKDQILPNDAEMAAQNALAEMKPVPEWVQQLEERLRNRPGANLLTFWGAPVVTAAIIACRLGEIEAAREALSRRIAEKDAERPAHAKFLREVYERLGLGDPHQG